MEYCLIDCATTLVNGPYETLNEARAHSDGFSSWEIIDGNGDLIDWSRESAEEIASAKTGTLGIGDQAVKRKAQGWAQVE
jgi:hypothetical protein